MDGGRLSFVNRIEARCDDPAGGWLDYQAQGLVGAAWRDHKDAGAVEVAVAAVEVAGAHGELVGVDLVAYCDARGGAVLHAPGVLGQLAPGQLAGAVGVGGEALDVAGVLADHVGAGRPGGQCQVDIRIGKLIELQRDVEQV